MFSFSLLSILGLYLCAVSTSNATYILQDSYDASNWYSSFQFQDLPDPTHGFVDYISMADAQAAGLTRIINNQVYMGVDNNSVISSSSTGRKSIWIESNKPFLHGLLIGDFAHIPASDCGTWPSFWTIRNGDGTYGEIDIIEGFNDITQNYMTLHTGGACSFNPPANSQLGTSNDGNTNCNLDSGVGCSVKGPSASYGTPFNAKSGGVYAMDWTSSYIRIYMFHRDAIPADITAGNPDPSKWGLPAANFESAYGSCDIDSQFPPQTIYFDTTFCGESAGGRAWTDWTDCSAKTGTSTCESYVAAHPEAYDDAYWLINSVKVYQNLGTNSPVQSSSKTSPVQNSSKTSPVQSSSKTSHTKNVSTDDACGSVAYVYETR